MIAEVKFHLAREQIVDYRFVGRKFPLSHGFLLLNKNSPTFETGQTKTFTPFSSSSWSSSSFSCFQWSRSFSITATCSCNWIVSFCRSSTSKNNQFWRENPYSIETVSSIQIIRANFVGSCWNKPQTRWNMLIKRNTCEVVRVVTFFCWTAFGKFYIK